MVFGQWKKQHFNISCAAYAQWEVDNDPSFAEQQLNKHLKEFGIGKCFCGFSSDDLMLFPFSECPNCKFRYQLAKGGCMHFRCLQCGYDFCGGCSRPFKLGNVSAMQCNAKLQCFSTFIFPILLSAMLPSTNVRRSGPARPPPPKLSLLPAGQGDC